jgi:hypothetical protein
MAVPFLDLAQLHRAIRPSLDAAYSGCSTLDGSSWDPSWRHSNLNLRSTVR